MNEEKIDLLANEKVVKAILKLAIPMIMGMMVQVLYNLVDTYFIGQLGDANQLAAANLALPIFVLLMGIASMIGTGASSYISRCLGKNDYEQVNQTTSIAVALLAVIGLVVTLLGIIFLKPIVRALGASNQVYIYTYQYAFIMILGAVVVIGNFAYSQLLRAEGSAIKSMIGMVIGTVLNLILDPLFIFTFGLGVTGAALATIIGNLGGFIYYSLCFMKGQTTIKIKFKLMKIDEKILGEIFKIGIPSSLTQILAGTATIVANNIGALYGVETVAAFGVATKIILIGTFIFIGFSSGCQPLIGYNYGAGNLERVKEIIKKGSWLTATIGVVLLVLFTLCSSFLISIFIKDEEVIRIGTIILRAILWSLPFLGRQFIATVAVQSMGKAIPAIILSISRQGILYIPMCILLNSVFGFYGFIFAQPLVDVMMNLFAKIYMIRLMHRETVTLIESV